MTMLWAFGLSLGSMFAGALAGGLYMQRLVKQNAEHAVMEDHRVSSIRKAAIVARIRGCPMDWVLCEMERKREEIKSDGQ